MRSIAVLSGVGLVSLAAGACGPPPPAKPVEVEPMGVADKRLTDKSTNGAAVDKPADKPADNAPKGEQGGGQKAPVFSLDAVNGKGKVTIVPGKVMIVDFWATWCEPCKKSFPKLQELYVKYQASGLEIAAISVDDESKGLIKFAKAHGDVKFPIGWDKGHKVADQWKPEKMPSTYVVDKSGVVRHVHQGYHEGEMAEIEKELKALF
jgi:cytochrome c biogenesis protein CcmG, thiol:disulfide interchange protein DsbE